MRTSYWNGRCFLIMPTLLCDITFGTEWNTQYHNYFGVVIIIRTPMGHHQQWLTIDDKQRAVHLSSYSSLLSRLRVVRHSQKSESHYQYIHNNTHCSSTPLAIWYLVRSWSRGWENNDSNSDESCELVLVLGTWVPQDSYDLWWLTENTVGSRAQSDKNKRFFSRRDSSF